MKDEGRIYRKSQLNFNPSKVHGILTDRSYLGEIRHHEQWYRGIHEPIIDRSTFDRVQVLLGNKTYSSHESVYGSALVKCAHCGRPLACEIKEKKSSRGVREYRYYRCTRYNVGDHPRERVNEREFDKTMLDLFVKTKVNDPKVRRWIENVIRAKSKGEMEGSSERLSNLARSGVHPSVAQSLARHSAIALTMGGYTHVALESQREAVAALPDVSA